MSTDARLRDLCAMPEDHLDGLAPLRFWMDHLHPADRERVVEARERMHSGEVERLSIEYRYCPPGRGECWIHHLAGASARDERGRAVRMYGVLRDITERRRAEEALRALYAEIERLTDRLRAETDYLKAEMKVSQARGEITGQSPAILKVLEQIEQVAPTDSTVLILGETGFGKELVAEAIHRHSARRDHPLVKLNCAALRPGLLRASCSAGRRAHLQAP